MFLLSCVITDIKKVVDADNNTLMLINEGKFESCGSFFPLILKTVAFLLIVLPDTRFPGHEPTQVLILS